METMSLENYNRLVKSARIEYFKSPYDLAYENLVKLGYDQKDPSFFAENASLIIENLRKECWEEYQIIEKEFTTKMLKALISDNDELETMSAEDAIVWFVESFSDHIYQLTLSNTQSRRSRAGKEFEAIIELIMIGAEIPVDSQGNIGKKDFLDKGLGKLVDMVSPGVTEYLINKRNTVLISAKTTLRERWQEVPEEMSRTAAREMFLATLDENISDNTLNTLYEANIQVTTTASIKENHYPDNLRVLSFEKLIEIANSTKEEWSTCDYSDSEKDLIKTYLTIQADKHNEHLFVKNYYLKRLNQI